MKSKEKLNKKRLKLCLQPLYSTIERVTEEVVSRVARVVTMSMTHWLIQMAVRTDQRRLLVCLAPRFRISSRVSV